MRVTHLHGRTRVLLFLFVAVGMVLLPYGMLYIFEGMETEQGGISTPFETHLHDIPASTTIVNAKPEVIIAPSSTTFTTSPTPSPSPAGLDLPKRALTPYVNPLIGTEGFGHCTIPCLFF